MSAAASANPANHAIDSVIASMKQKVRTFGGSSWLATARMITSLRLTCKTTPDVRSISRAEQGICSFPRLIDLGVNLRLIGELHEQMLIFQIIPTGLESALLNPKYESTAPVSEMS